jgi:putative ABC transport system permease protein
MTPGIVTAGATIPWLTMVGVVPTLPNFFPDRMADPVVYAPLGAEIAPQRTVSVIVRTPSKAIAASSLRAEIRAIDPDLPLFAIQTLDEARARWPVRVVESWFLALALIAMALASVGLYAITAHEVAQRSQEIGVRMALGAESRQVVWLFTLAVVLVILAVVAMGASMLPARRAARVDPVEAPRAD